MSLPAYNLTYCTGNKPVGAGLLQIALTSAWRLFKCATLQEE
jgi:hypothetical protein